MDDLRSFVSALYLLNGLEIGLFRRQQIATFSQEDLHHVVSIVHTFFIILGKKNSNKTCLKVLFIMYFSFEPDTCSLNVCYFNIIFSNEICDMVQFWLIVKVSSNIKEIFILFFEQFTLIFSIRNLIQLLISYIWWKASNFRRNINIKHCLWKTSSIRYSQSSKLCCWNVTLVFPWGYIFLNAKARNRSHRSKTSCLV